MARPEIRPDLHAAGLSLTTDRRTRNRGMFLVFSSAVLFSLGGLCVKMIPWSAFSINSARCLISCLILGIYIRATGHKLRLTKGVAIGVVCVFGTNLLYTFSNKLTTAANAILLQFTAPVFIILLTWLFFREAPKRRDVVACICVFGGITCFFLDGLGSGRMLGNLLALASGLTYAGVFFMGRIPGGDPLSSSFFAHLCGGLVGLPFLLREQDFGPTAVGFALILGVFQLGLAYICLCSGIRVTPPISASLIAGVEPILNPVLVAVFLHERISPLAFVGGGIVLVTILIYNVYVGRESARMSREQTAL